MVKKNQPRLNILDNLPPEESEVLYHSIFENANDAIFLMDDEKFIECNLKTLEIYGCAKKSEIIGKTPWDFSPPKQPDGKLSKKQAKKVIDSCLKGNKPRFYWKHIQKDGTLFDAEVSLNRIVLGKNRYIQALVRDITERQKAEEALNEGEKRLQSYLESAPDYITTIDKNANILYINKVAPSLNINDVIGTPVYNYVPKKYHEVMKTCYKRVFETGRPGEYYTESQFPDGNIFSFEAKVAPIIQDDKVIALMVRSTDITDKKKAEEALKESEEKFSKAFYSGPDSISISVLESGKYVDINDAFCKLSGYTKEEAIGKTSIELKIWKSKKDREKLTKILKQNGRVKNLELELQNKKGETVHVLTSVELIDYENKPYLLTIVKDVSDRKKAEEALRDSEEKYRSLVEHIPDVTWTSDEKGGTTFISPNVERVYGYTPEEIYKAGEKLWFGRLHPEDVNRVKDEYGTLLEKGTPLDIEYRIKRKDGEWIWLRDRSIGTYERDGKIYADGVFFDITKRKKAEIALKESEERYRTIFDTAFEPILVIEGYKFIEGNDVIIESYGYKHKREIIGHHPWDISPPKQPDGQSSKELAIEKMDKAYSGIPQRFFWQHTQKDGSFIDVDVSLNNFEFQGKKYLLAMWRDITERKRAEDALKESEEKFSKIFQASPNYITLSDLETNRRVDVNDSFTKITGYTRAETIDTTVYDLNLFVDPIRAEEGLKFLVENKSIRDLELKIRTKSSEERILLYSGEVIEIGGKEYGLVVAEDITDRKAAELELKRRLMKYDLEIGNIYLIKEGRLNKSLEAFSDLLKVGYKGIILSRTDNKIFERNLDQSFEFNWLSDIDGKDSIKLSLKQLENWANELPRGSAILLDRLDYIISKLGFEKTLAFIERIHDQAFIHNHIFILNVDPKLVDNKIMNSIGKETRELEPMVKLSLPEDLLEVLRFIYDNNIAGVKPKYRRIQNELNLSKPTVRKRIKDMLSRGLVLESMKGSSKIVELTDKGKALFLK